MPEDFPKPLGDFNAFSESWEEKEANKKYWADNS